MRTVSEEPDFRIPRIGSKYAVQINEGCTAGLYGMAYANRYTDPMEHAAFQYGYSVGAGPIKAMENIWKVAA